MHVSLLGVPVDLGANRRGVDMGPSAIRYALLRERLQDTGCTVEDLGNLPVPDRDSLPRDSHPLEYFSAVLEVNEQLARRVDQVMKRARLPVILGGDHSLAIGSIAGSSTARPGIGLLYFDAHGDFNTLETSPSGNIHGMSLAVAVGEGCRELVECAGLPPKVAPERVVVLGCRDLDARERESLKESPVTVFTMQDIDARGLRAVMEDALALVNAGAQGFHVSFDLDVLDPLQAPGVGTPVAGGLTYREAHLALEMVAETAALAALDMVEVNPILDERNRTAELAVELVISALGKRIL